MRPNLGFNEVERVARMVDDYTVKREREQMKDFDLQLHVQKHAIMDSYNKSKKEERKVPWQMIILGVLVAIVIVLVMSLK